MGFRHSSIGVESFGIETTTLEEVFMRIINEDDEEVQLHTIYHASVCSSHTIYHAKVCNTHIFYHTRVCNTHYLPCQSMQYSLFTMSEYAILILFYHVTVYISPDIAVLNEVHMSIFVNYIVFPILIINTQ